jgi:hypothetical protein
MEDIMGTLETLITAIFVVLTVLVTFGICLSVVYCIMHCFAELLRKGKETFYGIEWSPYSRYLENLKRIYEKDHMEKTNAI